MTKCYPDIDTARQQITRGDHEGALLTLLRIVKSVASTVERLESPRPRSEPEPNATGALERAWELAHLFGTTIPGEGLLLSHPSSDGTRQVRLTLDEFRAICVAAGRGSAIESPAPAPRDRAAAAELPDLIVRIYAYIQRAAQAAAYADADGSDTVALNSLIREARDLWMDGSLRDDLVRLLKKPADPERCDCGQGDTCPLGRKGSALRCTAQELRAALLDREPKS